MSLWSFTLDCLFPPTCPGCDRSHPLQFCAECLRQMPPIHGAMCWCCGLPFASSADPVHLCGSCLKRRPHFRRARACATYAAPRAHPGPLAAALHRYKYLRDLSLAGPLAALLAVRCPLPLTEIDVIVPVPLHLRRLRWRGFNQAQLLAAPLAARHDIPLDPFALSRIRATAPQVGLDAATRRRNVVGAFRVRDPQRVKHRRVLLVDDVYTSGATINECSRALRRAGAAAVDVLVLARAVVT